MVAPVIVVAGAMAGSAILNYVLNEKVANSQIRQADYVADYTRRYNSENRRYWADYYKNTGFSPRYPMRSGFEYNISNLYGAIAKRNSEENFVNVHKHVLEIMLEKFDTKRWIIAKECGKSGYEHWQIRAEISGETDDLLSWCQKHGLSCHVEQSTSEWTDKYERKEGMGYLGENPVFL